MRKQIVKHGDFVAAAILLVTAAACSGSSSTTAPTSPTPVSAPAAPPSAPVGSAVITGTITGASTAASSLNRAMGAGLTVTITGTGVTSGVDASGHFSLNGAPAGDNDLGISGNGVNAHVTVAGVTDHEVIQLTVNVSGSTADIDEDARQTADNHVEVEGRITAIDTAGRTLQVAGKTVNVPSNASIGHGATAMAFADLKVGDRVHAQGTMSGTVVVATKLEVQSGTPGSGPVVTPPGGGAGSDDKNGDGGKGGQGNGGSDDKSGSGSSTVDVSGPVVGKSGVCPALSFSVSGTVVTTSSATTFANVTCATLANGDPVEVKGTKQSNGSVLATGVKKDK